MSEQPDEKVSCLSALVRSLSEEICTQPGVGLSIVILVGQTGQDPEVVMSARMANGLTEASVTRAAATALSDGGPPITTQDRVVAPDCVRPAAKA